MRGSAGAASASRNARARSSSAATMDGVPGTFVAWRFPITPIPPTRTACTTLRSRPGSLIWTPPRCSEPRDRSTRIAFACPARRDRNRAWCNRVTHAVTAAGGRACRATSQWARIPLQGSSSGSAHTGTSCRQRIAGRSRVASSTISRRCPRRWAGRCCRGRRSSSGSWPARSDSPSTKVSLLRLQARAVGAARPRRAPTGASPTLGAHAHHPRRPSRLHAGLRLRPRGSARPEGRRRSPPDVPIPVRHGARGEWIRPGRQPLPGLLADRFEVHTARLEGRRASVRPLPGRRSRTATSSTCSGLQRPR